ncbi:MAG: hypothetical protein JW811_02295 [Clostridiales bacterium]|nr:hypothetical protein [Clostridiales bacterium]
MKDSDLIFGLMASFDKEVYSFGDLRHLTAPFHVSVASLRTSLSRMSAAKVVSVSKGGRNAYYSFGIKGRRISNNVSRGFQTPDWTGWDGAYWGVSFSVPEAHGDTRHYIRKKLTNYRFACLNPGFWIRPAHPGEHIPKILDNILSSGYCRLIRFHNHKEFTPEQAATLWSLREINRDFLSGLKLLEAGLKKLDAVSPQQALVEKMTVGDAVVNILFSDPLLPPQFLPSDWQGETIRKTFFRFDDLSTKRSKPYWEQIFDQEDTP